MAFVVVLSLCSMLIAFVPTIAKKEEPMAISCYKCNSAYDADCGNPFNRTVADARYLVDCNDESVKPDGAKGKRPVGCRIIDVQLLKEGRILRECAYSGENVNQLKKAGSRGVVSYITQCSQSQCNKAMPSTVFSYFTILLPIGVAMLLRY